MTSARRFGVGDAAQVTHVFRQEDVIAFAGLSGDGNPVHLDEEAAIAAGFPGTIVHGMLSAALISRILGTQLPGPGTIYLGQEMRFRRPILPGEEVVATVEVVSQRGDKPIWQLKTTVTVDGALAIDGVATVLVSGD